ncbi:MAG: transcriptional repressor [Desulfovibrio sp.]|nr:transcriptional repressor [Desulfovibrio sp.]
MPTERALNVNDFYEFMKQKGMNTTSQRKKIASKFFDLPGHHSLEEFYHIISEEDPSIGQTTVYRTLKLLCEAGFATEIHFSDDITRYEIANPKSHHDHLICLQCGKVIEVYNTNIESIQKEIAAENGFILTGHVHNLYGICAACRNKKADE